MINKYAFILKTKKALRENRLDIAASYNNVGHAYY